MQVLYNTASVLFAVIKLSKNRRTEEHIGQFFHRLIKE
jgi:hypothetical protein